MRDLAMDIDGIISIADKEGCSEFLFLHVEFLNKFPMDETGVCSAVNESILGDATLSLA